MAKEFKTAAKIRVKQAGVADYNARKAIADWLRAQADRLVSDHSVGLSAFESDYKYAGPKVEGGPLHYVETAANS